MLSWCTHTYAGQALSAGAPHCLKHSLPHCCCCLLPAVLPVNTVDHVLQGEGERGFSPLHLRQAPRAGWLHGHACGLSCWQAQLAAVRVREPCLFRPAAALLCVSLLLLVLHPLQDPSGNSLEVRTDTCCGCVWRGRVRPSFAGQAVVAASVCARWHAVCFRPRWCQQLPVAPRPLLAPHWQDLPETLPPHVLLLCFSSRR